MSKCYQLNMNVNNVNEIIYDIKRFLMYNGMKGILYGSIKDDLFCTGIITPCVPVSPQVEQALKKPWIFSFIPPTGCSSPIWFTLPVTAISCLTGKQPMAERRA